MTQKETYFVIKEIIFAYPNWLKGDVDLEEMTIVWHKILEKQELANVQKNLYAHVKSEKFAPALSDLTRHVWRELP